MLTSAERHAAAAALRVAEAEKRPIAALTDDWPGLEVADAYEIQLINARRRSEAGALVKGHKVGLTSKAMQEMLGVDEPDYGHLFDDMFLTEGTEVAAERYCAPRVEVEIGFVLGAALSGPGCTITDVLAATEYVVPCIELIDSRIRDWRIALVDTIADNASSAGIIIGGHVTHPDAVDLRTVGAVLSRNGEIVDTGCSGAVLGNPASAVAWLANKVAAFGVKLEPGQVILPGSCTRAHDVAAGDVIRADFDRLGPVQISFV